VQNYTSGVFYALFGHILFGEQRELIVFTRTTGPIQSLSLVNSLI
jgi:hypothetical protein